MACAGPRLLENAMFLKIFDSATVRTMFVRVSRAKSERLVLHL